MEAISRNYFSTFLPLLLGVVLCNALVVEAEDYKSLVDKAREQLQSDRYIEALATARDAVRTNGDDYKGHYYMAMACMSLDKFDDAMAAAMRAQELAPDNAKPAIEKLVSTINARRAGTSSGKAAEAALAEGMAGKAARLYEQAWNAQQDNPDLGLKAADLYANRLSQPVDAGRVLRQVIVAAKGSPAASTANAKLAELAPTLRLLAQDYVASARKQQGREALQTLQMAENADPSYEKIYELRAQLAANGDNAEDLQNAIKDLTKHDSAQPKVLARLPNMAKWLGQPAFNEFLTDLLGGNQTEQLRQLAQKGPIGPAGELINVPAGCFDANGKTVCLDAFRIGKYEVTQGQYTDIMGNNPSFFNNCGDNCPVEQVSWDDTQEFIRRLNDQTGKRYRLPTEAEWEYACRSGGRKEKYCGGNNVDAVAWYVGNSDEKTHPVGQKQPNGLGIYDMSGNVYEWVSDWKDGYFAGDPRGYPSGDRNPTGPLSGSRRVIRGGYWGLDPEFVRADYRYNYVPSGRYSDCGFRLVLPVQ